MCVVYHTDTYQVYIDGSGMRTEIGVWSSDVLFSMIYVNSL